MYILRITLSLTILISVKGKSHPRKHHHSSHHNSHHHSSHHHSYYNECPCGESEFTEGRVINGEVVEDYRSYPWIVGILYGHKNQVQKVPWGDCTGALISPTFVLSAAHCFPPQTKSAMCWVLPFLCNATKPTVQIGLLGENKYQPTKIVPVKRIINHPGFERSTFINDIALLELQHSIHCTPYSKPICVNPPKNSITLGKKIHIAGFGEVSRHYPTKVLREGTSSIIDGRPCTYHYRYYPSKQFCAVSNGKTRVCVGDSGSSAFIQHKKKYYSVGLTSNGDYFCLLNMPVIFTRTDAYLHFIREHVKDLPKQPHG